MPSSDPVTIPKVLSVVSALEPLSILDVGAGNGRYGFLLREALDWNWGRLERARWKVRIDAVEVDPSYITPIHDYVYDNVDIMNWLYYEPERQYDLIFMGDVLEHWQEGQWQQALKKAQEYAKFTLVVSPNWRGSTAQGSWHGHHQEKHWVALSPGMVGGRCLFASSKTFMCVFDNHNTGLLEGKDVCL
jgi:SAM-dependent methyltransferase